jgi:tRNA pseudouridine-54 N-methylase
VLARGFGCATLDTSAGQPIRTKDKKMTNIKRDLIAQLSNEALYTFDHTTQNNAELTAGLYSNRGYKTIIIPVSTGFKVFVKVA